MLLRLAYLTVTNAFAALLTSLPREVFRRLRLLLRSDTVLRWHRDRMKRRHAHICRPKRRGRPPTVGSIRALILRLVRENRLPDQRSVTSHWLCKAIAVLQNYELARG
ncbi:hypothetical protein [Nonomuraea phyllanthi]|uniref:hypothetical protein n=1 Tax=Nonomuraea phyllanthi TaxID=2219224 RepID=UPI001D0220E5|nr:hypothetical protein [Nonomuraea phyllanthi]